MNPTWGTKRTCPGCSTHFYDLNKLPATCPKCENTFDPTLVVRAKRKAVKREAPEAKVVNTGSFLASKKAAPRKKESKEEIDAGDEGGLNDIAQLEDVDDLENLQELSELEEIEEKPASNDDADDESIIEEIGEGGKALVGNIEEEEASALNEQLNDDEKEISAKKAKSKKKPR